MYIKIKRRKNYYGVHLVECEFDYRNNLDDV